MKHTPIALPSEETSPPRYGANGAFRPGALALVLALHLGAVVALSTWQIVGASATLEAPLIVNAIDLSEPPPQPEPPSQTETQLIAPPAMVTPAIALPRSTPVVVPLAPAPAPSASALAPIQVDTPMPPSPAPVVEPARSIMGGDISSSMIHAPPPRYPRESRRRREQGIVLLAVLLSIDGYVADIRVARSSGHSRLDTAARETVRRWRWSPTIHDGSAVQVRGTVEIPFVLTG